MTHISRRTILKSIGLVGAAALTTPLEFTQAQTIEAQSSRWAGQPLGRVASAYMNLRDAPSTEGEIIGARVQDDLVRVKRVVEGQTVYNHNNLWLETKFGYLYSSFVQPMWYHLPNTPTPELGEGRWAQLTVPFSEAYWEPDARDPDEFVDTFYYGSTVRVTDMVRGTDGHIWYKVKELYQTFYLRATHLRLIPAEDLTPLSPEVNPTDKWIEVDLRRQILIAYEEDRPVFSHLVSTGLPDYATPEGTFYVFDKRPSERMVGGRAADEDQSTRYNLGGVPYTCYFTGNWVAFHGCYWHNDYGIQRSRGCVNLPMDAARFIWRWTTPHIEGDDLNKLFVRPSYRTAGTRVWVHN